MRRHHFKIEDSEILEWIMTHCDVGYLGIMDPLCYPRSVPLNFIFTENRVIFHGALDGEKFEILGSEPKVTFTTSIPYSIIPSYWTAKDYACPASTFYKSVTIRGTGKILEDVEDKARFLNLFMGKYQPEGKYRAIDVSDSMYRKGLEETAVFTIETSHVDVKCKFGQHLSIEKRKHLIIRLEERNKGMDQDTADEIKKNLHNYL